MKFRLLTVVWGDEFCDLFLRLAARSLLAPGNLQTVSERHEVLYSILTTELDKQRISKSPVFDALTRCGEVDVEIVGEDEFDPANPASHWLLWKKGIEEARQTGASVIYIMPDIVYAVGTLDAWVSEFERGKRAIFTLAPEVVLETTLQELEKAHPISVNPALAVDAPTLNALGLKHLHPYHLCMLRDSERWVGHPEFIGYRVGEFAIQQRVMGSHPLCFDPNFFEFNHCYAPTNHLDKIAYLPSMAISLEPLLKFVPNYYRPSRMTSSRLSNQGLWFDYYTDDANDLESARSYALRVPNRSDEMARARADACADFYRAQCFASRTIYRIWKKLTELGCGRAAEILAAAHYAGRARRVRLLHAPATILVPTDAALATAAPDLSTGTIDERRNRLLDLLYSHCFPGDLRLGAGDRVSIGQNGELLVGNQSERAGAAGTVIAGPVQIPGFSIYVVNFVVEPTHAWHRRGPLRRGRGSAEHQRPDDLHSATAAQLLALLEQHSSRQRFAAQEHATRPAAARSISLKERLRRAFWISHTPAPPPSMDSGKEQDLEPLRRRIELAPEDEATRKQLVRALLLSGCIAEANVVGREHIQLWRELGGDLVAQGHVDAALHCRRRPIELAPHDVQFRKELIRELLLLGRAEEAEFGDGGMVLPWRELGGELLDAGQLELGLQCRRRAFQLAPDNMQLRIELVRDLLIAGREEEARIADGGFAWPWRGIAGEFFKNGNVELALECRRRAVKLEPTDLQVHKELVLDLLLVDHREEAVVCGDGMPLLWRELSGDFTTQKRAELAKFCLRQTQETNARNADDPVDAYFETVKLKIGLLVLRELLKSNIAALEDWSIATEAASPLKHLEKFLQSRVTPLAPLLELDALLEHQSDFAEAWVEKAFLHSERGELVQAAKAALHALGSRLHRLRAAEHPHPYAEAAKLVGECAERVGLLKQAVTFYRKSLEVQPRQPLLRASLGLLLWRDGAVADALKEFNEGMEFFYPQANLPYLKRRLEQLPLPDSHQLPARQRKPVLRFWSRGFNWRGQRPAPV